ncbi:hypothetical protein OG946_17155 [Streptomyces sp. NBC_01808]|uniref:hypothetical protein n=1 Tax=Streptomyces sp. NBC_01808 TaxID=2975947 RepID=UPI002DDA8FFA|nr:hypothetical protein [Streptomyces sp. NBC_01808]WSA38943.1 hypothetical protein OG946_17155 [Streptomyces sp. NBC_01808]
MAGIHAPAAQIGGHNFAPITLQHRPKLPTRKVPQQDLEAAAEPLWANTPTPQRAVDVLRNYGLAVIVGEPGTGRRISAVRALTLSQMAHAASAEIFYVSPDWDDDETPDNTTLPSPVSGRGYIIDASSRPLLPVAAQALVTWVDELRSAGAFLVVLCRPHGWKDEIRYVVDAVRPAPLEVAHKHLVHRLRAPQHASWLKQDPNQGTSRGILRNPTPSDPSAGVFADLFTSSVSPQDAVDIAERLERIEPQRVSRALEKISNRQPAEVREEGSKELKSIRDEVLLWTSFLEQKLTEAGTRGQDRVMLLAAAYLEDAPLEMCIRAAAEFNPQDTPAARRFREGRSPRRRMRDVGVDVTQDDRAGFDSKPGLAAAAIRTDWHHWADERDETTRWLKRISAPGGIAEAWSQQIGERVLELSRTAVEAPFFPLIGDWINAVDVGSDRIPVVARLLTEAALTDELARETHRTLLNWAAKSNSAQRMSVALVCRGDYGQRWPSRALVRLRHILAQDDDATEVAAAALISHAERGSGALSRAAGVVEGWIEDYPGNPAGPRAFLALVDPEGAATVLKRLMALAQKTPEVRDFLISGWLAALHHTALREQTFSSLLTWAQAAHAGQLQRDLTFGILTEVRDQHTPLDAMYRFLYGSPERDDQAIIDARFALAKLSACEHGASAHPDCPLGSPVKANEPEENTAGENGTPQ